VFFYEHDKQPGLYEIFYNAIENSSEGVAALKPVIVDG
jgi:hypothetical protein